MVTSLPKIRSVPYSKTIHAATQTAVIKSARNPKIITAATIAGAKAIKTSRMIVLVDALSRICGDGDTINLLLKAIHLKLFFWSDQALCQLVDDNQLASRRAYIRAAATLDAQVDLQGLQLVDVLHLICSLDQ